MTDHAILWAIFVVLFVALVLVIVTARRGPWKGKITSGANHFTEQDKGKRLTGSGIPDGVYIRRVDSPTQVTLGRKHRWWNPWS